jgi:hypothetical protein
MTRPGAAPTRGSGGPIWTSSGRRPDGGSRGAQTVRQSVRRRRFGAGITRRATRALPEEFAQSRSERDLTVGSIRTHNPLPARACGFKSSSGTLVK